MPSEEHRLHPVSLVFTIGNAARNLLLPGLFVLFAASGSSWQGWIMLGFVPAVAAAVVRFITYRYRFEADELVIREGVITRNERHVPYSRVQNIDLVQNVLHRLFGVAEVRVETAGGEKPEAVMRVLSLDAVQQMRAQIFAARRAGAAAAAVDSTEEGAALLDEPDARLLHSLAPRDVLLYGVISNKGMLVVAAAMGLLWQFNMGDWWEPIVSKEQVQQVARLKDATWNVPALIVAVIGLLLIFVVLMRLLSIVWAFLQFYGFRLQGRDDDLRAEYGLLTRISKTIPRHRIQVVSVRSGLLHRLFGRASVVARTAGGATGEESGGGGRQWLAPLIREEELPRLLQEALPGLELQEPPWQPIAPRAWLRVLRQTLVLVVPVVAAAVWFLQFWALLVAIPLLALSWINARLYARFAGYALVPGAVLYRSGWWWRKMSVVRFSKIQSVERSASPFDRRNRMATVKVDTAGTTWGQGVEILFLEAPVAAALAGKLGAEAARTSFRW